MNTDALMSDCGQYRYKLSRIWNYDRPKAMFIMLNPSTADAAADDPTIRRCIGFAKSWGYGGILVGNLFPYRSTDPAGLLTPGDKVGKINALSLREMMLDSEIVVAAWGNGRIVRAMRTRYPMYRPLIGIDLSKFRYLRLSKDGTPTHPLYLPKDLLPQQFKSIPDHL